MTTIIDGSAGITFPSGSNPQAAPSKVLQVVQGTSNTTVSTTSASYVTTGLSASITPLFSSSKILISYFVPSATGASQSQIETTIYRGSTNIALGSFGFCETYSASGGNLQGIHASFYLDSPATTSSTTYTIYFQNPNNGLSVSVMNNNLTGTITLMEIAQ